MTFRKHLIALLALAALLVACGEPQPPVTTEPPLPTYPITELYFPTGKEQFSDMNASVLDLYVAEDNPSYTAVDGVIFTKGLQTLVAFPRGRTGEYTVPDGTLIIGENAFKNCQLESVYLPDSVQKLSDGAFAGCMALRKLSLPRTLTAVGTTLPRSTVTPEYPIGGITLRVRGGNTGIPDPSGNLVKIFPELNEYEIVEYGAGKNTLGRSTVSRNRCGFLGYEGTDEVYTTYSAAYLAEGGNVPVPGGYIGVAEGDFYKTKRPITAFTFPMDAKLDAILSYNVPLDSLLRTLTDLHIEDAKHARFISIDGVVFTPDKRTLVAFPVGRSGHYTVPEDVEHIGERAFFCTSLTSISFPSSIQSIHANAFGNRYEMPKQTLTLRFTSPAETATEILSGVYGNYVCTFRELKKIYAEDVSVTVVSKSALGSELRLTVDGYVKTIEEHNSFSAPPTVQVEDLTGDGYPDVILTFINGSTVHWSHARVFDGVTLAEYDVDYSGAWASFSSTVDEDAFYIQIGDDTYTIEKSIFGDKEPFFDYVVTQNFYYDSIENGVLHRSLPCQLGATTFYGSIEIDFAFTDGEFVPVTTTFVIPE